MNTTEYPPRHLPPFRPLVPGEAWHRNDFTPDMLPKGWRPLMLHELPQDGDEVRGPFSTFLAKQKFAQLKCSAQPDQQHQRTNRPLPPPTTTFEYDGKTWNSHVPGDPCPVDGDTIVTTLLEDYEIGASETKAKRSSWGKRIVGDQIIGYRIPDAEPVNETAKLRELLSEALKAICLTRDYVGEKMLPPIQGWEWFDAGQRIAEHLPNDEWSKQFLARVRAWVPPTDKEYHTSPLRERIAELELLLEDERKKYLARSQHIADLEYDLRTALTPRPIAEAGPVQKGFERVYIKVGRDYVGTTFLRTHDTTHFYDIRLPEPDPRAEYERAVAEAGGHYEAWLKAKQEGGVA